MLKKIFYMLIGILSFVGACVIVLVLHVSAWISMATDFEGKLNNVPAVPEHAVLRIDFSADIPEGYQNAFSFASLKKQIYYPPFIKVIEAVKRAKNDNRIVGIYAKLNDNTMNTAQVEEFRDALLDFKKSGKKTVVYATGMNPGLSDFYLASAFDEVWMPPHSLLPIIGVTAKFPFFKKLLDKIGINPVVFAKYEYKGFMSSFTDEKLSEPIKQNISEFLADSYKIMTDGISLSRKIPVGRLKDIINNSPLTAEKAKSFGLVDKVLYRSQVEFEAKRIFGNNTDIQAIDLPFYVSSYDSSSQKLEKIAYIVLDGEIKAHGALSGFSDNFLNDEDVFDILLDIEKRDDLKGIILRVNSPGGAYDIADSIRFELQRLKLFKKVPMVVSFGGTAASGGYFLSTAADYIFTDKLSVTGSIGAVSVKFDISEALKKLDIGTDTIKYGDNADVFDITSSTDLNKKVLDDMTTDVYEDFIQKVSGARKIEISKMNDVARGRVFSGIAAKENLLADEIGGIFDAVNYLEKKTGKNLDVVVYPKPKAPLDILKEKLLSGDFAGLLNLNKVFFDFLHGISNTKVMVREQKIEIN